jgi:hypothetical protein
MFLTVQYIAGLNQGVSASNKGNWQNADNVHLDELVGFTRNLSNTELKTSSIILDLKHKELVKDRADTYKGDYDKAYAYFYANYTDQLNKIDEYMKMDASIKNLAKAVVSTNGNTIPTFANEAEEAAWWDANQDLLAERFEAGAANGTLGCGTVAAQHTGTTIHN